MIFGDTPLGEAEGAILAHSVKLGSIGFKKGRVLSADDLAALEKAGVTGVVAARLEDGDMHEDDAASAVAAAIMGKGLTASAAFTGRANLVVDRRGVLVVERARLDALNRVEEAITVATLAPFELVEPRQMAATVKVIPFAVPGEALERCLAAARAGPGPLVRVDALRPRVGADVRRVGFAASPRGRPRIGARCGHEAGRAGAVDGSARTAGSASTAARSRRSACGCARGASRPARFERTASRSSSAR